MKDSEEGSNEDKDENKENKESKEKEEKEVNNDKDYNELYYLKLNYYKNLENISMDKDISSKKISEALLKEFIIQKYSNDDNNFNTLSQHDTNSEACLINAAIHITGLIFNDKNGIGFYSYETKRWYLQIYLLS